MKVVYDHKGKVEDDLQIFGMGYPIDRASFIDLISKGKGPDFIFDDDDFGLENAQFEVSVENSRLKCLVKSFGTNQEKG